MIFNCVQYGGGGGTVSIEAVNYSVLPSTGKQNDIAVIGADPITETVISIDQPSTPVEGMIWFKTSTSGDCILIIGNVKIHLSSANQYINGSWVLLSNWYVYVMNKWVRGRLYLIQDGKITNVSGITISARTWVKSGKALYGTANLTQQEDRVRVDYQNTRSSGGSVDGYGGMCTSEFEIGGYSSLHFDGRFQWTVGNASELADIMISKYNAQSPDADAIAFSNLITNTTSNVWYSVEKDVAISPSTGNYCVYIGTMCLYYNRHAYTEVFNLYLE